MILQSTITIPTLSDDIPRRLYVYLPPDYAKSKRSYPVLYMFDGHNIFFDQDATYGKSWGMNKYLKKENPALILVAIECNHQGNRRLCEYSPWSFDDAHFGSIKGDGERSMEWLVHELKPWIDAQYRTRPGRESTYIAGSSMGGLMTIYALTQWNHVFSKGAALSPSLWCQPQKMQDLIQHTDFAPDTVLYMDYGSKELDHHEGMLSILTDTLEAFLEKEVCSCLRIVPGGEHCEASWEQQIPIFMRCLGLHPRPIRSRKRKPKTQQTQNQSQT